MLHVNAPIRCPVYTFCVPRIFTLVNKVESPFKVNMNTEHSVHTFARFYSYEITVSHNTHIYMQRTLAKCIVYRKVFAFSCWAYQLYLWRLLNLQLHRNVYTYGVHTTRTFWTHFFFTCLILYTLLCSAVLCCALLDVINFVNRFRFHKQKKKTWKLRSSIIFRNFWQNNFLTHRNRKLLCFLESFTHLGKFGLEWMLLWHKRIIKSSQQKKSWIAQAYCELECFANECVFCSLGISIGKFLRIVRLCHSIVWKLHRMRKICLFRWKSISKCELKPDMSWIVVFVPPHCLTLHIKLDIWNGLCFRIDLPFQWI